MRFKNIFRTLNGLGRYYLLNMRTPLSVIFSVTHKCNYKCIYCQVPKQANKDLSTEKVRLLIRQMANAGTQRLGIQGGEPLLRNDIREIINFAKENGLFVTMGTNGSLVKRKIDDIKRIDALVTSYDGPKAHNIYRENGSSKKMIEAISTAVENGIKVWNVTVLSRNSMDDIDYILGLSREIGFHTYFTPMMNLDSTGDTSLIIPLKGDYKRAIEKLMKLKKEKSNRILNSVPYLNYIYNWPDFKKTLIAGNYNCYASKLFCHIAPNGKVFPCINLMHKVDGYDALGIGFKNAFSKLSRIECRCSTFSFVELNLLFSLNFVAICNSIKQL